VPLQLHLTKAAMKKKRIQFGPPVPEVPVADVVRAQQHYKNAFGFEVGWLEPGNHIGAVSRDRTVLFLRTTKAPFQPTVHWVFTEDLDACYLELKSLGAKIVALPEIKPWGLRQFTVADLDGNLFHFHA
jgi:hypothetical protein